MAHRLTRLQHPWPAVIMHWAHLVSFFVLIATGLQIHAHTAWFGPMSAVRTAHFLAMFVFLATTVVRLYWAFFGAGSAALGGLKRHPDWRHFVVTGREWREIGEWLRYYLFLRKTRPHTAKYNPLQKLTYGVLFPVGIVVMALSGFALYEPTASAFAWVAVMLGGLNAARLVHYLAMWVLIALFMVHLYLVLVEDPQTASVMLLRRVPRDLRVPGDYPPTPEGPDATRKAPA